MGDNVGDDGGSLILVLHTSLEEEKDATNSFGRGIISKSHTYLTTKEDFSSVQGQC